MKKLFTGLIASATILATAGLTALPAGATVNLSVAPTSLVTSPMTLSASSTPTALFTFTLTENAGETLSSVMAQIDAANASTTVTGSHLASLSIYKDDGSNAFNPVSGNLIGSQTSVNIGSPTTIIPASTTPASGKFYVSLATSGTWSSTTPADSVTAMMPINAITTSANSPSTSSVSTAAISAQASTTGPQLISAVAQNTGGTAAEEAGDSVALTFNEPTNMFAVNSGNIGSQFTLSNGHSFLDGFGNIGGASWTSSTVLTITISGNATTTPSLPTVVPGDMVTMASSTGIADTLGNLATGSQTITGNFGTSTTGLLTPIVSTAIHDTTSDNVVTTDAASSTVRDGITVTGSGAVPTGDITLTFFNNGTCASPAAATSSAMPLVDGSLAATAFPQGPLAAGSYSFMANYGGDSNYMAASSDCESLTITSGSGEGTGVGITTSLSSNTVASNTPVTDSATLSNASSTAGGTVMYNVYSGDLCSGTPIFTDTETVTNGSVPDSVAFTPTADGTYNWQAVYSGDANNAGATSTCGDEVLTVSESAPSQTTCPSGLINGDTYLLLGTGQKYTVTDCVLQPSGNNGKGNDNHRYDNNNSNGQGNGGNGGSGQQGYKDNNNSNGQGNGGNGGSGQQGYKGSLDQSQWGNNNNGQNQSWQWQGGGQGNGGNWQNANSGTGSSTWGHDGGRK